jgi:hypothetical protein
MVQAGHLGRADSPLAGHQLIAVENLGDDHRLQHAVDGDAAGQGLKGLLLDALAWLIGVAANP